MVQTLLSMGTLTQEEEILISQILTHSSQKDETIAGSSRAQSTPDSQLIIKSEIDTDSTQIKALEKMRSSDKLEQDDSRMVKMPSFYNGSVNSINDQAVTDTLSTDGEEKQRLTNSMLQVSRNKIEYQSLIGEYQREAALSKSGFIDSP